MFLTISLRLLPFQKGLQLYRKVLAAGAPGKPKKRSLEKNGGKYSNDIHAEPG